MTTSSMFPPPNCLLAVLTKQNLTTLLVIINRKLQLETLPVLLWIILELQSPSVPGRRAAETHNKQKELQPCIMNAFG